MSKHNPQDAIDYSRLKIDRKLFDVKYSQMKTIHLNGVGKLCACGCGNHVYTKKRYVNNNHVKAKWRKDNAYKSHSGYLCASVNIKNKTLIVYLKKGIRESIPITPEQKQLWDLVCKIEKFRDLKSELMLTEPIKKQDTKTKHIEAFNLA